MSDPIPSAKAHPDPDEENESLRTNANAEDRKAAAALSSMQTNEIGAESVSGNGVNSANQKALNNAMGQLEITAGQGSSMGSPAESKPQVAAKKPTVKVTELNVALLMKELELTRPKATDLLKTNENDALKAMIEFIAPPILI